MCETDRGAAVEGKTKASAVSGVRAMFKTAALMIHDTSNWRGEMSRYVITMEMCSFPFKRTPHP